MDYAFELALDTWNRLPADWRRLLLSLFVFVVLWSLRRLVVAIVVQRIDKLTQFGDERAAEFARTAIHRPFHYLTLSATFWLIALLIDFGAQVESIFVLTASSLLIIGLFLFVYALINDGMRDVTRLERLTGIRLDEKLLPFTRTITRTVLVGFVLVIILNLWGYNVNGLVAGLGIGGLAIALAAQDTLANLFGFTLIVGDQPFVEGEFIVTPDVEGVVESVGLRSTRIRRLDQALVTIPNSKLSNDAITNWSRLSKRRYETVLALNDGANSTQMRQLLQYIRAMLNARPYVEKRSIVVAFTNFGQGSFEVLIRCYILLSDWGQFTAEKEEINLNLMDILRVLRLDLANNNAYIGLTSPHAELPNTPALEPVSDDAHG